MEKKQSAIGRGWFRTGHPNERDAPTVTDEEAAALARAVTTLLKRWELSNAESCVLLAGMSRTTWSRWKKGSFGRIGIDLRIRMAHLMGIHKGVRTLFADPGIGYAWIREPGEHFSGRSALDLMLRGEMVDLAYVRDWIGAETGA